jgi:DNA helicase-4
VDGSMVEEFLGKIKSNEYISNYLYQQVLSKHKDVIPTEFDIDKYNDKILDDMYVHEQEYFNDLYKDVDSSIKIDYEQARAIMADEDYSLIIAGAGTGKTTTIVAKVKYLVEKKGVNPSDIVVISFTKKTTEELRKRIVDDFNIAANVFTFHSLGYKYIRYYEDVHVIDENDRHKIFLDYMKNYIFNDKDRLRNLVNIYKDPLDGRAWILGKFLAEHYAEYNSFDEYFNAYKADRMWQDAPIVIDKVNRIKEKRMNEDQPRTLKGELVKSYGEAKIANYLYMNGIDYKYEKVYKELVDDSKEYKPDFTINNHGEEIYIEYFGLSNYKDKELKTYEKIRKKKEEYHARKHTNFIKIDYYPGEDILTNLYSELIRFGVKLNSKSYYDIYEEILNQNPTSEMFRLEHLWYEIVDQIKSSINRDYKNIRIENYLNSLDYKTRLEYEYNSFFALEFYDYYNKILTTRNPKLGIDYNDMIYYANKFISDEEGKLPFNIKYLIIDEYQDISFGRYALTKNLIERNHGKIVAVGDDWQSIYGFSGSKIEYVYNFERYYKGAKLFRISTTYRNGQSLVDYAGEFIMRNPDQIKKELVSTKDEENPIKFVTFEKYGEYDKLKEIILNIHKENPNHEILVLARKNSAINNIFYNDSFIDSIGTSIKIKGINDIKIDGMSIHKSKGLTTDDVIIIGLNKNFPVDSYCHHWLIELFRNKHIQERIDDAEERRVFYVALTRAKHNVYLLINENNNYVSPFVTELKHIISSEDLSKE